MLILTLRTDKPDSEIGLYQGSQKLDYQIWQAHRQLAETLHSKIRDLLAGHKKDWHDIGGVVVYVGPGSFTGLRIGISAANALAASLEIPIIGNNGMNWLDTGIADLLGGQNHKQVLPEYGGELLVSKSKK